MENIVLILKLQIHDYEMIYPMIYKIIFDSF